MYPCRCYARVAWSSGYQSGDPKKRYSHPMAIHVWTSLLVVMFAAVGTSLKILL